MRNPEPLAACRNFRHLLHELVTGFLIGLKLQDSLLLRYTLIDVVLRGFVFLLRRLVTVMSYQSEYQRIWNEEKKNKVHRTKPFTSINTVVGIRRVLLNLNFYLPVLMALK